jgi:acyl-CoA thioesterase
MRLQGFVDSPRLRGLGFRVTRPGAFPLEIPFIDDLGAEFVSAHAGRAVVELALQPKHLNSFQVAHGGVLMALLDVTMAFAARSLFELEGGAITIDLTTSFLQPAAAGTRLSATATAFHRTSSLAFCEGGVRDAQERLVARAQGTFKCRARRGGAD